MDIHGVQKWLFEKEKIPFFHLIKIAYGGND